jgi:hypothetical protein
MFWIVACVVLGLALLLLAAGRVVGQRAPKLGIGWATGVVGDRGSGKSLFVARLIALRLEAGVNVVANFGVPGCSRLLDWEDAIMAPVDSMIVIDEMHQWAGAEGSQALGIAPKWYLAHARKLGHEVWWIAQDEMQVHAQVRRLTNEYVECKEVAPGYHRAASYPRRVFRAKTAKATWSWWYTPKGAATRVFDTNEFIRPTDQSTKVSSAEWVERINIMIDTLYERRGLDGFAPGVPDSTD